MNESAALSKTRMMEIFETKYSAVDTQVPKLFGGKLPVDSYFKMLKFPEIASLYFKAAGEKYLRFIDAYKACPIDSSVVYFSTFDLYCVLAKDPFKDLVDWCRSRHERGINIDDLKLYKIIVAHGSQKPVFIFNANTQLEKLKEYAIEHFKCDVAFNNDENSTQIVITGVNSTSEEEAGKIFKGFCEFVGKNDSNMAQQLQRLPVTELDNVPCYRLILQTKTNGDIHDFNDITQLGMIQNLTINIIQNQTIENNISAEKVNQYNGEVTINNTKTAKKQIPKTYAEKYPIDAKWVLNNKPIYDETTSEYYARYQEAMKNPIHNNKFGPLATEIYGEENQKQFRKKWVWRLREDV